LSISYHILRSRVIPDIDDIIRIMNLATLFPSSADRGEGVRTCDHLQNRGKGVRTSDHLDFSHPRGTAVRSPLTGEPLQTGGKELERAITRFFKPEGYCC